MGRSRKRADSHGLGHSIGVIFAWATRSDVHREVMRRAHCDLAARQVWLLTRIASAGPTRQGDLAASLRISRSTLTPQIQRLERSGLVSRSADPADRRVSLLRVTRKGHSVLRRLNRARADLLGDMLDGWPAGERARTARALARIARSL